MDMLRLQSLREILVAFETDARLVHLDLLRPSHAEGDRQDYRRKSESGNHLHLWLSFLSAARVTSGAIAFRKWCVHIFLHHARLLRSMRLMAKNAIEIFSALR